MTVTRAQPGVGAAVVLFSLAALGGTACGGKTGTADRGLAPPVAVKAMPPVPDLSKVRTFAGDIPGVVAGGAGVTSPTLERLGDLVFPPAAWNDGRQGWVVFDFVVNADGRVNQKLVRLVAASDSVFVAPAEQAVRAARFAPAIKGGEPVAKLVRLPVHFTLEPRRRDRR
ncbi:MAG: energy transducer TonB [Gemmatimonadota bacterium]|nr:energy transducer TonB [Gemmatimonadota bacterium]